MHRMALRVRRNAIARADGSKKIACAAFHLRFYSACPLFFFSDTLLFTFDDDNHLAVCLVSFHYTVRFPNVPKFEHTRGLGFEPSFRHVVCDTLQWDIRQWKARCAEDKVPKKVR